MGQGVWDGVGAAAEDGGGGGPARRSGVGEGGADGGIGRAAGPVQGDQGGDHFLFGGGVFQEGQRQQHRLGRASGTAGDQLVGGGEGQGAARAAVEGGQ